MAAFIRLGLYAIKKMCPWVTRFTLKDDSKIYCDGLRGPSISMAYDYLIRYDQTWYQKKFGAVLDGSVVDQHLQSLEVLDKPCREFEVLRDMFPEMEEHRAIYEASASPRDFLKRVRASYGDPAQFCRGVSKWFDRYMSSLRIQLFMDSWFIPAESIEEPVGFSVGAAVGEDVLKGGTRSRQGRGPGRRIQKGRWHGISHARGGSGVGTYGEE